MFIKDVDEKVGKLDVRKNIDLIDIPPGKYI